MPRIKPKLSINRADVSASKQFTNRTGHIETFWNAINNINRDDTKVLVYYGIGGIGKTSLRKKIQTEIEESNKDIIWGAIDFEVKQHRESDNALIYLRSELSKKYKIKFPLFDCAYAYYLKKTSPQIPLDNNSLPFLEDGDLVTDIITTFHDMPLVGIPTKIGMLLNKSYNKYTNWVTKKRIEEIIDIAAMDSKELLEYLPVYFAEDILSFLQKNNRQAVIFLDTYEALWENSKNKRMFFDVDEWIRNVFIPNLPGVLFIILGREKLRWEEENSDWADCLEQHLIGKLAHEDTKYFLNTCHIFDEEIINRITTLSDGHPYSLDLCVDTYYAIKKNRIPNKNDFSFNKNKIQIYQRLMRYLEISERETLKFLSIPRFWDYEVFELLVKEFNTGFPLSALQELCHFSFISERIIKETWEMHSLMRKSLQNYLGEKQLKKAHQCLFEYYTNMLDEFEIREDRQVALNEGYYHGKKCLDKETFIRWFLEKSRYFIKVGDILFLQELFRELWVSLNNEDDKNNIPNLFSRISYILGEIYINLGKYNESEAVLETATEIGDELEKTNIMSLLCKLYKITYNYEKAEENFINTIKAFDKIEMKNTDIKNSIRKIKVLIEYGKLKVYLSQNSQAIEIYEKAIREIDDLLSKNDEERFTLLNCRAVILEKLGEINGVLSNYELSGSLYMEAKRVYDELVDENELFLEDNSDLIYLLNNKGMINKRLAEYYVETNNFEEAEKSYRSALEIYEKSIERSSQNVDTYKKVGFASRGLLRQLVYNNQTTEKINWSFNKCLEGFEKAVELSPKDVSAIHSISGAYTIMGKMFEKKADYDKAIEFYDTAIEYSKKAINIQPDFLYAYDGKAETLTFKGDIYYKLQELDYSLKLYQEALSNINEVLVRTPDAIYAEEKKNNLISKINKLKTEIKDI